MGRNGGGPFPPIGPLSPPLRPIPHQENPESPTPHQVHGPPYPKIFGALHGISSLQILLFRKNADFAYILPNKRENGYFTHFCTHFFCLFETPPDFVKNHAPIPPSDQCAPPIGGQVPPYAKICMNNPVVESKLEPAISSLWCCFKLFWDKLTGVISRGACTHKNEHSPALFGWHANSNSSSVNFSFTYRVVWIVSLWLGGLVVQINLSVKASHKARIVFCVMTLILCKVPE